MLISAENCNNKIFFNSLVMQGLLKGTNNQTLKQIRSISLKTVKIYCLNDTLTSRARAVRYYYNLFLPDPCWRRMREAMMPKQAKRQEAMAPVSCWSGASASLYSQLANLTGVLSLIG